MNIPKKQTVYLSVNTDDPAFSVREWPSEIFCDFVKQQEGYFFTTEELNNYTSNVIKQALETAKNEARIKTIIPIEDGCRDFKNSYNVVDEHSITNTFEEIFKKFEDNYEI